MSQDYDEDDPIEVALSNIAHALYCLGNQNAGTDMGAIEAHGLAVKEGCQAITDGLHDIADALREQAKPITMGGP